MRRLRAVIIPVLLLFAVSAWAADLQVSESTIDYGTIKEGPPAIKKIVLTNTGNRSLLIAGARAS